MKGQAKSCTLISSSKFSQKFLIFPHNIGLDLGRGLYCLSLFRELPWFEEQKDSVQFRHQGRDLAKRNIEEVSRSCYTHQTALHGGKVPCWVWLSQERSCGQGPWDFLMCESAEVGKMFLVKPYLVL